MNESYMGFLANAVDKCPGRPHIALIALVCYCAVMIEMTVFVVLAVGVWYLFFVKDGAAFVGRHFLPAILFTLSLMVLWFAVNMVSTWIKITFFAPPVGWF